MASEARVGNLETMSRTTGWLKIASWLALSGCGWPVPANAAQDAFTPPRSRYEWDVASGVLWRVGGGATPLSYTVLPQIITLKIPPIRELPWAGGTLVYRTRFSLLVEPIVRGPEHYFIGTAAAGDLEWRNSSGRFAVFFAGGGGFGWMDSKGYEVAGGQGQDFNLNWLAHGGVRFRTRWGWRWSLSAYFQHISNRGMNKVNPGLNALGPMLSLSQNF